MNSDPYTFNPSELDKRITIQYPTKVPDGMGGFTTTWVDAATVWAKAWTVSSSESVSGSRPALIRIQKFKIRYRYILQAEWRVKWGERYFNITGIDPDERLIYTYLTCAETRP